MAAVRRDGFRGAAAATQSAPSSAGTSGEPASSVFETVAVSGRGAPYFDARNCSSTMYAAITTTSAVASAARRPLFLSPTASATTKKFAEPPTYDAASAAAPCLRRRRA